VAELIDAIDSRKSQGARKREPVICETCRFESYPQQPISGLTAY